MLPERSHAMLPREAFTVWLRPGILKGAVVTHESHDGVDVMAVEGVVEALHDCDGAAGWRALARPLRHMPVSLCRRVMFGRGWRGPLNAGPIAFERLPTQRGTLKLLIGVSASFRNSTSDPSDCKAIRPRSAVASEPSFTRSPLTQTLIERPTASTTMVFHSPTGFSELSVRLRMRRALPSVVPHRAGGPRRRSMSGTWMSSTMHQKSPAFPCSICTSMERGNIPYRARGVDACTNTQAFPGAAAKRYSTSSR